MRHVARLLALDHLFVVCPAPHAWPVDTHISVLPVHDLRTSRSGSMHHEPIRGSDGAAFWPGLVCRYESVTNPGESSVAPSMKRAIRSVTAAGCSACSQWPALAMVSMDAAGKRARMRGSWRAAR